MKLQIHEFHQIEVKSVVIRKQAIAKCSHDGVIATFYYKQAILKQTLVHARHIFLVLLCEATIV